MTIHWMLMPVTKKLARPLKHSPRIFMTGPIGPRKTHIYYELDVDEIRVGNCCNGIVFIASPLSSSSRKRTSNTTDIATSPNKKTKSPMVKMF
uniref:Uncharacterized protein n=1 Tax=Setaria viridis TaxID=4556 RepID=A0A4U6VCN3_SETVI|nr:hypothetical protein SEVIR_3G130000v2 [Setaria viridis]